MRRTIIVVEHDGLETREFSMTFEVPSKEFDLVAAIRDVATDYCKTPEGASVFSYNCNNFNWADFETYVTNELCERHGFRRTGSAISDITVDWDEQLVDEAALADDEEEM